MKNVFTTLYTFLFVVLIACGQNKKSNYEIIDQVLYDAEQNNIVYTVYASDTNWLAMYKFASELLEGKGEYSAVGFFYPREKTPKLQKDGLLPKNACDSCLIANYIFDFDENRFKLAKMRKPEK